jgi:hypothetical protein
MALGLTGSGHADAALLRDLAIGPGIAYRDLPSAAIRDDRLASIRVVFYSSVEPCLLAAGAQAGCRTCHQMLHGLGAQLRHSFRFAHVVTSLSVITTSAACDPRESKGWRAARLKPDGLKISS